jgi:mannose-6-phosphate isomerase-like protein (cupin superfamily)
MATDAERLARGGWLLGVFFGDDPHEGPRATEALEVKYWTATPDGSVDHPTKISETTEWSVILSGRVTARLGADEVELRAGDYVLIHPGTPNNLVATVMEDVAAITVKAPSDPTAKTVVGV